MKSDDPLLTTYALDELDAKERAAFEEFLSEDFAALAEVDATRTLAANLRMQLQAQPAGSLHASQRAAVFEAARRRECIPFWRRPVLLSAAAACVIVGVSIRLLWPVVNAPWKSNPQYQARLSAPTFHFTLDNGPLELSREPLVPFIAVSEPAQFMASPPRIAFAPAPSTGLPTGPRFLPAPRFTMLAETHNDSAGQPGNIARNSGDGHRRAAWKADSNSSGRRLLPERLGAFYPVPSEPQPSFLLETGATDYPQALRLAPAE